VFQSFFPNLTSFYQDDFVLVIADMRAGSCVGSLFENLVDSVGNSVDETEQGIV